MTDTNVSAGAMPPTPPRSQLNGPNRLSGFSKSPGVKFVIIGVITVLLLIPTLLVWGVVEERASNARVVAQSISKGWGGVQSINGPYLAVPYDITVKKGATTERIVRHALYSAEAIKFDSDLDSEERKRSIYSTLLYHGKISIKGRFSGVDVSEIEKVGGTARLGDAFLALGVSDNSGFRSEALVAIDNAKPQPFKPGLKRLGFNPVNGSKVRPSVRSGNGIHLEIPESDTRRGFTFAVNMALNGSRSVHVVPAAKNSEIVMKSDWPHPGFDGRFLPETRNITDKGFSATWTVPNLARGIDAVSFGAQLPSNGSVISVNFVQPLKFYQVISRTVKYAIAFFALIFLATFILEQTGQKQAHWIQYILVGLAMVIFYILLLALAEHVGFNLAYLVSASATTILVGWYVGTALARRGGALIMGSVVGVSYLIIYLVMKEQEFALLAGAIIAFAAIAVTMVATRKVDWTGGRG